ncbi:hypothetical protein [Cupriavidus consociatus]|uniref:hypothetical protein n=1 Tax=Cupriavidus consociatus TaxID=2821357 RepID=UPI001AEAB742|nr:MULTISPECIES: hypothetical protein [unclassified Cupriavidus]MBP0625207.1 hypothetical protein [Cupriavidus sp. LEh25]MDK2661944.1 hypothetical protein [Cupriavidus sp. LEh21]
MSAYIQVADELLDSLVELAQAVEAVVAQPRQDSPLDDQQAGLDLGLIVSQQLLVMVTIVRQ